MSLQFMDDFGSYGSNNALLLDGVYAQRDDAYLLTDPDPNESGIVLEVRAGATPGLRKVLTSAQTTVGIALRMWPFALPNSGSDQQVPMEFQDGANSNLVLLRVTTTGALEVVRNGTGGTVIASSDGPVITADAWQHIEMKVVFDASVGTVEVRVEGVPVIDETGLDTIGTGGASCAQVSCRCVVSTPKYSLKDLVIWDGSGSENNDFLGAVFVARLVPTSDDTLNWSVSEGTTGWDLIDESPPNDDTDYIFADDTPPAASLFGMEDLPADAVSVKGVMPMVRATKTDGGDGKLQVGIDVGGTVRNGADRAITAAYTYWFDTFDLAPDGTAWTPSDVNSGLLRVDRTL